MIKDHLDPLKLSLLSIIDDNNLSRQTKSNLIAYIAGFCTALSQSLDNETLDNDGFKAVISTGLDLCIETFPDDE